MITLITDKVANSNIALIKTQGAKRDQLLHVTALYCINQANQHGNVTPMNKLFSALNKSDRKEALSIWLRDHAKVVLNTKNKTWAYNHKKQLHDTTKLGGAVITIEQALENANAKPFYDYTKESKPSSSMDLLTAIESLIKRAKEFTGEVKHKDLLNKLEGVIPADTPAKKAKELEAKLGVAPDLIPAN